MSDEKRQTHVEWAHKEMDDAEARIGDANRILILAVARLADEVVALRDDGYGFNDYIRRDLQDLSTNVCAIIGSCRK
jgi:hypothetical protein